jgi:hypothetical protein
MPPTLKSHQAASIASSKTNFKTKKAIQKPDSTFSSQKSKRGKDTNPNEDQPKAFQTLSKSQKAVSKELEKEKHESKSVILVKQPQWNSLLSDIRKRSAAMAAAETDEEDQDPVTELVKSSSKKRKQMLNEAEASLADSLGSDLPDASVPNPPSSPSTGDEDWVGGQDPYDCECII